MLYKEILAIKNLIQNKQVIDLIVITGESGFHFKNLSCRSLLKVHPCLKQLNNGISILRYGNTVC